MSTTTSTRHRIYRISGEKKGISLEMPVSEYYRFKRFADERGWSIGEATRRAIAAFLAGDMVITNDLYARESQTNGHHTPTDPQP